MFGSLRDPFVLQRVCITSHLLRVSCIPVSLCICSFGNSIFWNPNQCMSCFFLFILFGYPFECKVCWWLLFSWGLNLWRFYLGGWCHIWLRGYDPLVKAWVYSHLLYAKVSIANCFHFGNVQDCSSNWRNNCISFAKSYQVWWPHPAFQSEWQRTCPRNLVVPHAQLNCTPLLVG